MNILHITGHLGGGIGSTLLSWIETDRKNKVWVHSLDYINSQAANRMNALEGCMYSNGDFDDRQWNNLYKWSDIVVVHWWPNIFLDLWIAKNMPPGRVVFWGHNNYNIPPEIMEYPDKFITTSPVMGAHLPCIKSTGDVGKLLNMKSIEHDKYNVGYVGTVNYKKMHPSFIPMCQKIYSDIPDSRFIVVGEYQLKYEDLSQPQFDMFNFMGKLHNPDLQYAIMDVFGYPLRHDHYGTSELVIGEAMASGIPVVCMKNQAESLIIQEGVNGFLCRDEDEYIENIEHLYHKQSLRRWMGDNARESASEMYDIFAMTLAWNEVFEKMMDTPKNHHDPVINESNYDDKE